MRLVTGGMLAIVLGLGLLGGGCELFQPKKTGPLVADAHSPVADVPVPTGFTRTSESTSKQNPSNSIRFVNHKYKGSDGVLPVVSFYKEQLPKFKWAAPEIQEMGKEVTLTTTNDRKEVCTVTVTASAWGGSVIHITINPAGQVGGGN
jgi:hypothetical protein